MLLRVGQSYERIDACPCDRTLYWGPKAAAEACEYCHMSRRVITPADGEVPRKTLRYFPVTERLQRMFRCPRLAHQLVWHARNRSSSGTMRSMADSPAWAKLDSVGGFGSEDRNIRCGISSDGVNPGGHQSTVHSVWPVLLVIQNLPPWIAMRKQALLMPLIIPGPRQVRVIDVYLQPLMKELQTLWEGVMTVDYSRTLEDANRVFNMRVAVLHAIGDYPGLGFLLGIQTRGYRACVDCGANLDARHSNYLDKTLYNGYRRWVPVGDVRQSSQIDAFNSTIEARPPPPVMTVQEILAEMEAYEAAPAAKKEDTKSWNVKRWALVFRDLPYLQDMLKIWLKDVMHTEKNNAEACWKVFTGQWDSFASRKDMKKMDSKPWLWPIPDEHGEKVLPPAPYILDKAKIEAVKDEICHIRPPTGFGSNIGRAFEKVKVSGLKTHDWHLLMEFYMPIALRGLLDPHVYKAFVSLSQIYRLLCQKEIKSCEVVGMKAKVVDTLVRLEQQMPSNFWNSMQHLILHLVDEVESHGPVHTQWMYFVERHMKVLKEFVRQKAKPEGSMAAGYMAMEATYFASEFLAQLHPEKAKQWYGLSDPDHQVKRQSELRNHISSLRMNRKEHTGTYYRTLKPA